MRVAVTAMMVMWAASACGGGSDVSAPVAVAETTVSSATAPPSTIAASTTAPSATTVPTTTTGTASTAESVSTTVPTPTTAPVSTTTLAPTTVAVPTTVPVPTTAPASTTVAAPGEAPVPADYDYRQDDSNVLNHLFAGNEACLRRELGDATITALRTRPMDMVEAERSLRCFGDPGGDPDPPPPPDQPEPPVPGEAPAPGSGGEPDWDGPRICTSHGVFMQPPDFGVVVGDPLADPTAAVLDDGRIRLYAYAQDIGIVSAVSVDGRSFTEEPGVRVAGTDGGQPRIWRLDDGRWRLYVSKVREIVSFTSVDGLVFTRDAGARLTASEAGLPAISSPSIIELEPGRWRMYYSTLAIPGTGPGGKRVGSATSVDLMNWTVEPGWRLGEGAPALTDSAEHPFPVAGSDGSVSLFYGKFRASTGGAPDGLYRTVSVDGLTFTEEAYTGLYFGNDPEVLRLPGGDRIIYYGDFDPQIGGQLLSATCSKW